MKNLTNGKKMKTTSIGIIGYGFVGKAVNQIESVCKTNIYDPYNALYNTLEHKEKAYSSNVVFINVPTDPKNGGLDISIVERCMEDYLDVLCPVCSLPDSVLVIKSTIPVGTCAYLSEKYKLDNIVFNPEFLSQRTAMEDFVRQTELYLAGSSVNTQIIKELYEVFFTHVVNDKVEIFESEAWEEIELLKLARNTFYGIKVSYCNHLYNLCEKRNINYEDFRQHFARGEWVGAQHTVVPGPDKKFGYGGKCLPKDSAELLNFFKKEDIIFEMLEKSIGFNDLQRSKK